MRSRLSLVLEALGWAVALGVLLGILWWALAPDLQWLVTPDGVSPTDPGSDAWFGVDGWFLILGALSGVELTLLLWRRHRTHPVLLAAAVTLGSLIVALTGRWVGGVVGPVDPESLTSTAPEGGVVVDGALELLATGVLLAPTVAALTLLVLLLAAASPSEAAPVGAGAVPAPPQSA
jgi:hypothetical protein